MIKEFIGSCKNIFNFRGRARRREYWIAQLWLMSILLLDSVLAGMMQYIPEGESEAAQIVCGIGMILAAIVFLVVLIGLAIMGISLSIRRCHDIGMSGWVYLLCMIGSIVLAIVVFVASIILFQIVVSVLHL